MSSRVSIGKLSEEIMKGLNEYAALAADDMKSAVKKAGDLTREEIKKNAPVKSGKYKASWRVKKTAESSASLTVTVHSKNRYQLAHLLEFGHANRNGGRTKATPHIAPAEKKAEEALLKDIKKALGG